jgi:hypothetical protein
MKTMKVQIKGGRVITVLSSKDRIYHIVAQIKKPMNIECLAVMVDGFISESFFTYQWSWEIFPEKREEYGVLMAQHYAQIPDVVNTATVLPSLEWMRPFIPTNEAIKAAKV